MSYLSNIEKLHGALDEKVQKLLDKLSLDETNNSTKMDIDQGDGANLINSLSAQAKISKSHDIANMKLKYEEKLEEKNLRIVKLEKKNTMYLDIIAEKEAETSMIRSEDANSEKH